MRLHPSLRSYWQLIAVEDGVAPGNLPMPTQAALIGLRRRFLKIGD